MSIEIIEAKPEFASHWYRWRTEPQARAHNPILDLGVEDTRKRLSEQVSSFDDLKEGKIHRWFVKEGDQIIGTVALEQYNERMKSASFGYHIAGECSGRGLGQKVVRLFLDHLFSKTQIERLIGTVHHENIASRKILEKIGFTEEGTLREYLIIDDERVDFVLFSILKKEWS